MEAIDPFAIPDQPILKHLNDQIHDLSDHISSGFKNSWDLEFHFGRLSAIKEMVGFMHKLDEYQSSPAFAKIFTRIMAIYSIYQKNINTENIFTQRGL